MSTGDDHLAPVIPLFGGGGAVSPDGSEAPSTGKSARRVGTGDGRHNDRAENDSAAPATALPTFATFWPGDAAGSGEGGSVGDNDSVGSGEGGSTGSGGAVRSGRSAGSDGGVRSGRSARSGRSVGSGVAAASNGWAAGSSGADEADEADEPAETLEAAQHRAENISMHALTRRGVSSREMEKTLRSRDLPDEVVLAEVERLERVGLLDDAALAETLVRTKQDRKGLGKSAIAAELRQRGLAQEAVDEAVAEIDDDEEQARADEWARKRAGQLRGLDHATAERRLSGYLMRRGYRSEVVRRAIATALPRGGAKGGGVRFE